jgi:gluconate 5-dehydrogenase
VIAVGRSAGESVRFEEPNIHYSVCDVQDEEAFAVLVKNTHEKFGRLDGLVNNASAARRETWDELDTEGWRAGLDSTLTHYFATTKAVSRYMLSGGKGSIINNASIFGLLAPVAGMYPEGIRGPSAHHAAAKAGVIQLTRYLGAQWAGNAVRVNAVSPGWFPRKREPERADFMQEVTARVPMGRIGQPSELVGAMVFLMSDAASYITGQNLVVDGGYSLW